MTYLTIRDIVAEVAMKAQVLRRDIMGETRYQPAARARQAVYWLAYRKLGYSFKRIGMAFGGRDHTTICHGVKLIDSMVGTPEISKLIDWMDMDIIATRRALIIEHLETFIGKPCPSNSKIGKAMGITVGTIGADIVAMRKAGLMIVESGGGHRRICIGGEWTAWSRPIAIETPAALKVLEYLKASVGKPCPTDVKLAENAGVKRGYIFHAISALSAAGLVKVENSNGSARRMKTAAGWTDWTRPQSQATSIADYVPPPVIELPLPRATCFHCGSSSLHPCRHLQAMGYRRAA